MKKIYSFLMMAVLAMVGIHADAQVYLIGDSPLGGWNVGTGGLAMEQQTEGTYKATVTNVPAGKYFAFCDGGTDWNTNVYRPASNGATPTGEWESTSTGGNNSWKTPAAGDYVFEFNLTTKQARISTIGEPVVSDPAYYLCGEFNSWASDINDCEQFTKDGDTFTLTVNGFSGQFKIRNEKGDWLGAASSDDPYVITKENCTGLDLVDGKNFGIATVGNYTFTIVNGKLSVNGWDTEPQPVDKQYYLIGSFNDWSTETGLVELQDGIANITLDADAEFKIIDNQSNWYGPVSEGNFVVTQDLLSQELTITTESGMNNFTIPVAGTWTITFNPDNMTMTIAGEWNDQPEPQPVDKQYYLIGSFNDWSTETGLVELQDGTANITLDADAEFKIIDNQTNWYGPVSEGNFVVTQDLLSQELAITTESGMNNFTIPVAGTWTITFNPESMTMTIAGEWNDQPEPQPADYSYYVIGSFNDWNVEDGIVEMHPLLQSGEGAKKNIPELATYYGATVNMTEGDEFKIIRYNHVDAPVWIGAQGDDVYWITDDQLNTSLTLVEGDAGKNFYVTLSGEWNIVFNPESMAMIADVEEIADGITAIDASHAAETIYYNAAGMKSNKPFKGMNVVIVKTANGTKTIKMVK